VGVQGSGWEWFGSWWRLNDMEIQRWRDPGFGSGGVEDSFEDSGFWKQQWS
jgi:hypothetical protein